MVDFLIISLTDKGKNGIEQHIKEKKSLNVKDRVTYKMLFKEKVISKNPFTFMIRKRRVAVALNNSELLTILHKTMLDNGAVNEKDYTIKVIK